MLFRSLRDIGNRLVVFKGEVGIREGCIGSLGLVDANGIQDG